MTGANSPEPDPEGRDARAEDDAWRDIVAHYGDRPELPDLPLEPLVEPPVALPVRQPAGARAEETPADRYVPPDPPPATLPRGPRAVAWAGVLGPPVVLLVFIVLGVGMPGWVAFLLFVAFVGGFGYLVATMRKNDDSDPWDDGAVV